MTKKPSLYVVERREVVILVVLFVLVTILAFTMGVKYGQNLGRREAKDASAAANEAISVNSSAGGVLGAIENSEGAPNNTHLGSTAETGHGGLSDGHNATSDLAKTNHGGPQAGASTGKAVAHGEHVASTGANDSHGTQQAGAENKAPVDLHAASLEEKNASVAATKPNSGKGLDEESERKAVTATDEYLLNALKEAGIERQQPSQESTNPEEEEPKAALPHEVKKAKKGGGEPEGPYFTIQVSSHTIEAEAKKHQSQLQAEQLSPMILSNVDSDGAKRYRVAIGKYSDRSRALEAARNYKSKGVIENYFIRKVR